MRRFLVWSGLAALVGLAIALAGLWAYNHFYGRFLPTTIQQNPTEVQELLDGARWVSEGTGGRPVYVITYRESPAFARWQVAELAKLQAGGADLRMIVFARADHQGQVLSTAAERSTVAELWLTRDWDLYQRWLATPVQTWTAPGLAPADGDMARTAVVDAGRQFIDRLGVALARSGVPLRYPLIIWRDEQGFLKACACDDPRSWAFVRDDLGASGVTADLAPPETPVDATEAPTGTTPLPYPDPALPGSEVIGGGAPSPLPPLPSAPPAARPAPAPAPAPVPSERTNEKADANEDTMFF
jgi:hypothetical protein